MRRWPCALAGLTGLVGALGAAVSCIPDVVPSASTLPRCASLDGGCGLSGTDDCCVSDHVAGGIFNLANDTTHPVSVDQFRLDRYEVTVGRFRAFVADYPVYKPQPGDGASPALGPSSGWDPSWNAALPAGADALRTSLACDQNYATWTDAPGMNENRPINCVTWYLAFAFCAWDSGRLPTEAEWNYTAAGGNLQRPYPWGTDAPDAGAYASFGCPGTPSPCVIPTVGSTPMGAGKWMQQDLAGSMAEWTLDYFGDLPAPGCGDKCADLTDAGFGRELRGGDFTHDDTEILTTYRVGFLPDTRQDFIGFRCARAQ
jgi:formylglycine-generating enzyme required for sulfatase activity